MIIYKQGDIFSSNAQLITNTVNCVGVMGKGLALAFKQRFPDMFADYQAKCEKGQVIVTTPYLLDNGKVQILNFPTKKHWKDSSHLDDIKKWSSLPCPTLPKIMMTWEFLPLHFHRSDAD
jgi:O-acetyl-ADP-ribose deacetylase (regulator of RNase III)